MKLAPQSKARNILHHEAQGASLVFAGGFVLLTLFDMKTPDVVTSMEDREGEESELCISCLKPNVPGTHFCRHCGTPLTSYAATAPFESIFAEGDMWRKAATRGRWAKPIRVLIIAFLVLMLLSVILGLMLPR
jgi:hypothetical protein